jgi:hypothetical protein
MSVSVVGRRSIDREGITAAGLGSTRCCVEYDKKKKIYCTKIMVVVVIKVLSEEQ